MLRPDPGPTLTTLSVSNQPAILVRHEPDAEGTEILVQRVMVAPPPDNRESERDELCRQLAERVFLRRIQTMVARDASLPLMNASVFSHDWLGFAHAGVRASVRQQSQAIQALDLAVTEYRRLLEYGPTDAELAVEHKPIAANLDAAVTQAGQRENPDLAGGNSPQHLGGPGDSVAGSTPRFAEAHARYHHPRRNHRLAESLPQPAGSRRGGSDRQRGLGCRWRKNFTLKFMPRPWPRRSPPPLKKP